MNMIRSSMQVPSIDTFTSHHFQQLFSDGNKRGLVTTQSNGRTYHIIWDTTTDTFSVKRDLTNVDRWTRCCETLERWSQFDFTSHAVKWEHRLTIQKHNVALAEPLRTTAKELLIQIDSTSTTVEPGQFASPAIQQHLHQISSPLVQSLEEKRHHLFQQTQQLSSAINDDLDSSHFWTQQQDIKTHLHALQEQLRQLTLFIANIKNTIGLYSVALGSIDVSKNTTIYNSVLSRLKFVALKIQLMLDTYFAAGGNVSKAEVNSYNRMIKNEGEIALAFNHHQLSTHFAYNELLSPPYYSHAEDTDAQKQGKITFNYQTHVIALTNVMINPLKTLGDIQNAADELRLARTRWQEQILLEEKIHRLLHQLQGKKDEGAEAYPIFIRYFDQLRELKKNVYNKGELLGLGSFELLQSKYQHMERANVLYIEIDQFLANLPGFIAFWDLSNYSNEMQSRILHLTVLRNMCQEEESLTEHTMDHMERFVTVHKNVLQQWTESEEFSRFTFYDPIPKHIDYPSWLVKEHDLFQQKTRDITRVLWETKYQALRNTELLKARGQLVEKVVGKTEELVQVSEALAEGTEKLHREYSVAAQVGHLLGLTSARKKTVQHTAIVPDPGEVQQQTKAIE